jgi:Flp pilus assembly protein TadB
MGLILFLWEFYYKETKELLNSTLKQTSFFIGHRSQKLKLIYGLVVGSFFLGGWLLSGHPILGLLVLIPAPYVLHLFVKIWGAFENRKLEKSALPFLWTLRGLLCGGISLPVALFKSCHGSSNPFAKILNWRLSDFAEGNSLNQCLQDLKKKSPLRWISVCFSLLETAYKQGMPTKTVFSRMLVVAQNRHTSDEKIFQLRVSVVMQAFFAFLLPWGLLLVMAGEQPELVDDFFQTATFKIGSICCLLWQCVGGGVIWKTSKFL